MLAKLRCSNHSLSIETSRHSKTEVSDGKCSCCNCNKVEDEIHFSVECLLYDLTRNKFFKDFSIDINGVDMKDAFIHLPGGSLPRNAWYEVTLGWVAIFDLRYRDGSRFLAFGIRMGRNFCHQV